MGAYDADSIIDGRRGLVAIPGHDDPRARAGQQYVYTPALGERIAEAYAESVADAGGLWALHHAFPEWFPSPGIVRAWCAQFPAFGTLMREAENVRAEGLMESNVMIADSDPGNPARVRLKMEARYRLAESLNPTRYGRAAGGPGNAPALLPRSGEQAIAEGVSDAELEAMVRAQLDAQAAAGGGGTPR